MNDRPQERTAIPSGIAPLDERTGGLEAQGLYLVIAPPGPAKSVALMHFVNAGLVDGERVVLLTNADVASTLEVAEAWGFPFRSAWEEGRLRLLGFREDFELRALRSVEPEEILDELRALIPDDVTRIAVDPGSTFLDGTGRTLLGTSFLRWARRDRATVCATLTVEQGPTPPAPPDWAASLISGTLVLEPRSGGLQQATLRPCVPVSGSAPEAVTLALTPGEGLVRPRNFPARRLEDLATRNPDRLLLVCLGGEHAGELERWAAAAFDARRVEEPLDAVSVLQHDPEYGVLLLHAPRTRVKEVVRACRALRPLTRAAIVFASDDGVRSSDRIALLEAGCDDTLSGGLDFRELELRLRQAAARGRGLTPPAPVGPSRDEGGLVALDRLTEEVRRRTNEGPAGDPFTLLLVLPEVPGAEAVLAARLAEQVRDEDGDRVARTADGALVLLSGARSHQAEAFVRRVRSARADGGELPGFSVRAASHPADARAVLDLMGGVGVGRG